MRANDLIGGKFTAGLLRFYSLTKADLVDASTILEITMQTLQFTLRQSYDFENRTNKIRHTC